jgi:hypothetical protein
LLKSQLLRRLAAGGKCRERAVRHTITNSTEKDPIMKRSHKIATGIALSLSLGLAASAYAHPGQMGSGMGPGTQGGVQHGAQASHDGMQHGKQGGMGHGAMARGSGPQAGHALMTPEERTTLREKMRNAATPEARQQIADATRAEMQKRAQEKGIALPEHRGPRGRAGTGPNPSTAPQAPAAAEHVH